MTELKWIFNRSDDAGGFQGLLNPKQLSEKICEYFDTHTDCSIYYDFTHLKLKKHDEGYAIPDMLCFWYNIPIHLWFTTLPKRANGLLTHQHLINSGIISVCIRDMQTFYNMMDIIDYEGIKKNPDVYNWRKNSVPSISRHFNALTSEVIKTDNIVKEEIHGRKNE